MISDTRNCSASGSHGASVKACCRTQQHPGRLHTNISGFGCSMSIICVEQYAWTLYHNMATRNFRARSKL